MKHYCVAIENDSSRPVIGSVKILDFQFLMDLQVFGCPDHDLTISRNARLCVCGKNIVASVAQELMHRISLNFIFSNILA